MYQLTARATTIRTFSMPLWMVWPQPPPHRVPSESLYQVPTPSMPVAPLPKARRRRPQRPPRSKWVRLVRWSGLIVLLFVFVMVSLLAHRMFDFGAAISTRDPLASVLSTTSRNSIVLLGYGGVGHDGPYLTDSIVVISRNPATGATALISVPRDLWVQIPPDSGQYAKLNAAYAYGVNHGGKVDGGALAADKVSTVLGLAVPYWVSIDFTGFEQMIDQLGGLDITVPDDFIASLSPSGNPSLAFHPGLQHMNGTTALIFARARYCLPAVEASDFARSFRQQLLLKAIGKQLKSLGGLIDVSSVMDALQPNVATNLPMRDLITTFLEINFDSAQRIALTNQNVLVDAKSGDGQAILLPQHGDWGLIQQYVLGQLGG